MKLGGTFLDTMSFLTSFSRFSIEVLLLGYFNLKEKETKNPMQNLILNSHRAKQTSEISNKSTCQQQHIVVTLL